MSKHRNARRLSSPRRSQRGFILVIGLFFLIVLTLLSVSMFRSFGSQERIAGNTRDKQRANEAAQSALQYGEWWLMQGNGGTGKACAGVVDFTKIQLCSNAVGDPTTLPWTNRFDYLPTTVPMKVDASGGVVTAGGDINYQASPGLYVSYLGASADGLGQLYQVTAFGYGGNANTASVVQSTYQIKSGIKDLGVK